MEKKIISFIFVSLILLVGTVSVLAQDTSQEGFISRCEEDTCFLYEDTNLIIGDYFDASIKSLDSSEIVLNLKGATDEGPVETEVLKVGDSYRVRDFEVEIGEIDVSSGMVEFKLTFFEYSPQVNSASNSEDNDSGNFNLIYYIIGGVIIIAVVLFFVFKKKK